MGKMGINDNNFNASVLELNIDKFIEIIKNNVYSINDQDLTSFIVCKYDMFINERHYLV